jgi:hypothetical protein
MYEYKCQRCAEKKHFSHDIVASKSGWFIFQMWVDDRIKYVVNCPAHRPGWAKDALAWAGVKERA